ncbi:hypothetical protein DEO72_LG9g1128 [Vigna unguiculata]|uniref:Uncharacterized protein n=1 Tax=Vigna unguiculata TaxID=3917 RepID=A0A4D6N292_VIGUN|nr:hypothetical protein DEO72_LG9g1128 [Vigna unguiculata]
MPWCTDNLGHVQNPQNSKLSCTKTFMVFIWGQLEAIPTLTSQKPRISFFHKTPHQAISTYAVVHRQPLPCAKSSELKTFVRQEFHGIHLGAFGGHSNPHISKTMNFIFSQNSPPSHLPMPWPFQPSHLKSHEFHFFTQLLTKPSTYAVVHRQPWPCAKSSELKTFVRREFHGIHLGAFGGHSNPHISNTTNFIFSQNSPPSHLYQCRGAPTTCAMCKILRTQNFRAPRISWYSFRGIWRPFQPSHLKHHKFHFFTKFPTEPSLPMPWCTDNLGHVQNPPNSKLSCTKTFMVFIWGQLEAIPTLTSQKPQISFFHKIPHQAISTYAVVHRQPWPCAKSSELKTFVRQEFHGSVGGATHKGIQQITFLAPYEITHPLTRTHVRLLEALTEHVRAETRHEAWAAVHNGDDEVSTSISTARTWATVTIRIDQCLESIGRLAFTIPHPTETHRRPPSASLPAISSPL